MPYCNTAFGPDYDVTFKSGLHARFLGAGECGMGGPIRGRLTIEGFRTVAEALRPFYLDPRQNERFMGYQELQLAGTPTVLVHLVDRAKGAERIIYVPFSAYVFQEITAGEFLLLDEYKGTTTVHRIDPPFDENA